MSPNSYAALKMPLPEPRQVDGETAVPTARKAYVNQANEPLNVSANSTVATVNAAIRAAEAGNTRDLFALYRDSVLSGSHVQAEFAKRKLAVISQPMALLPADKENADDVLAAEACRQAVEDCENFPAGLAHLMDSTLWPVSVVEKLFRPVMGSAATASGARPGKAALRWTLRRLEPVNHTLLCFAFAGGHHADVDSHVWEEDLRLYPTDEEGRIVYGTEEAYHLDPMRHVVHRGHLMASVRDNWGGPMRAVLFWWLLGTLGRDWFGRFMERYGAPFPVAKTDAQNASAVTMLQRALSLSTKIGGLVVDHETEVELVAAAASDGAQAYESFLGVCNREISKVIVGQTLSGEAQSTGLGSGTAKLQGEVRDDIRQYDQGALGNTLRRQLFEPFLRINGYKGSAPTVVWGGLSAEEAGQLGGLLVQLNQASLEPTDEAIPTISERVGFEVQRKVAAPAAAGFGGPGGGTLPFAVFNAGLPVDPTDEVARRKAAALAQAFRGSLAPVRQIVLSSATPEEAQRKMALFFADWKPAQVNQVLEEALQICAAAGAAARGGDAS
jgi:hypothetical protein